MKANALCVELVIRTVAAYMQGRKAKEVRRRKEAGIVANMVTRLSSYELVSVRFR
jgi:hypothetical protein